jgi:DnaJ-class molecular chaperone
MMTKEISLMDALCGVDFLIDFLDGKTFRVKTNEGFVIKPDQILCVEEKGLPFHKSPFKFGNLFIMFKIKFPKKITATQKPAL